MSFDYSRLRGKIREVYGTESEFASALKNMSRATLSLKLNGKSGWTQQEIREVLGLLNIPLSEVDAYFFRVKLGKTNCERGNQNAKGNI